MEPVLVLQHDEDSPPGLLGEWLDARGIPWELRWMTGPVPTSPDGFTAVVSLGSVASANDDTPWVHHERGLVQAAVADDVPVLGLCFGSQMLAKAAGGSVARATSEEFGWVSPVGEPGPVTDGPWFCWHEDAFTAPPGAEVLASSPVSTQAFTLGRSLAVQFHPEVPLSMIDRWIQTHTASDRPTPEPPVEFAVAEQRMPELTARAFALFDWWWDEVARLGGAVDVDGRVDDASSHG
jgi:GMP synthase-like glutamine amidotransferase